MREPIDVHVPGTGDRWLTFGLGFESERLSPSLTPAQVALIDLGRADLPGAELDRAAADAMYDLVVDSGLRSRLAEAGADRVHVTPAFVDRGNEPGFDSPRYTFRKRSLDVDAWFYDDGPADPEAFQAWVRDKVRGVLEAWLDEQATRG